MIVNKINKWELDLPSEFNYETFESTSVSKHKIRGIDVKRKDGKSSYFYNSKSKKRKIGYHFTAGNLRSDLRTLTTDNYHVSVSYLIGRNGVIYRLFDDNKWSYHLGRSAIGGNTVMSKETIGIELSNYGILERRGDNLYTIYNQIYCSVKDTDYYYKTDFRGKKYFASYTDVQIDSLIVLTRYLCDKHNINKKYLDLQHKVSTKQILMDFNGICSHINFRGKNRYHNYDKFDIGTAFDWNRVINGLHYEVSKQGTTKEYLKEKIKNILTKDNQGDKFTYNDYIKYDNR